MNGLVVPRGDEQALADAMRSRVQDRELPERLRPPPGSLVLLDLRDQVNDLEAHHRRILAARPQPAEPAARRLQRVW